MTYHGGPVQHEPTVYLIFWGSSWLTHSASREAYERVYSAISETSYAGILTEYTDKTGSPFAANTITSYIDTTCAGPSNVENAAITNEIGCVLSTQHWAENTNAQFVVMPAPGTSYASGFGTNSKGQLDFCGYHSGYSSATYSFLPYHGDYPFSEAGGYWCKTSSSQSIDESGQATASHEYGESVTDPTLEGWFAGSTNGEVGDLCAYDDGSTEHGQNVQELWDNAQNACSLSDMSTPLDHTAPSITMTGIEPVVGVPSLSSATGAWGYGPTKYAYQWSTCSSGSCSANGGTEHSYVPAVSDVGKTLKVKVTASNRWGSGTSASSPETNLVAWGEDSGVALREPAAGNQWLFWSDATSGCVTTIGHNVSGWTATACLGGHVAAGTSPVAVRDASVGSQWVYWVETGTGAIMTASNTGSGWTTPSSVGGHVAANSRPIVLRDPVAGTQWLFWVDSTTHCIMTTGHSESGWTTPYCVGGNVAANSSPVALRDSANDQWLFWADASTGCVETMGHNSSGWTTPYCVAGHVASGDSPVALRDSAGNQWVYWVESSTGCVETAGHNSGGWTTPYCVAGHVAANSSPVVLRDSADDQWIYWVESSTGCVETAGHSLGGWTTPYCVAGSVAANSSPAVVRDPTSGTQWLYWVDSSTGAIMTSGSTGSGWTAPYSVGGHVAPASWNTPGSRSQEG